mmetsp:Transcript_3853/g.5868  ORF Transcript_3853/g.5868 Transcript_3853/m.5868 type:complete len:108 (-) Transcript_3853:2209-2532(-)
MQPSAYATSRSINYHHLWKLLNLLVSIVIMLTLNSNFFSALTSGDAIRHHLEPAYFAAIMRATGGGKEKKLKLAEATESPPDTTSSASLKKVSENTVPKKVTAARSK